MKNKKLLWLDDVRDPSKRTWLKEYAPYFQEGGKVIWVKNSEQFMDYIVNHDIPDLIAFDHDLGENMDSGFECAKWLVHFCMLKDLELPMWVIQSSNPPGKENINSYLSSYLKSLK